MPSRPPAAILLTCLAFLSGGPAAAAGERVGVRFLTIAGHEPGRRLDTLVLYPAAAPGTPTELGDNGVFAGTEADRDAPAEPGRHPLVVVSHGSGGNAAGLSWLTAHLAAMGYVVAAPNHPGTTSGDSDEKRTVEIWRRPEDLSAVIDAMLKDPVFAPEIDGEAIGALGFSLGGYDVLALAGAEQRREAFAGFCERNRTSMGCDWLRRGGVDFAALDPRFDGNHRDPRVKAVVAVDPAFTPSYAEASLKAVRVPVQFVNLGTPAATPGIVEARFLADTIPEARLARVPDAVHYSFLGLCRPEGPGLVASAGEEPICSDAGGRPRDALHADMVAIIARFLTEVLPARR